MTERFDEALAGRDAERAKVTAWARESIAAALARPGLFRAWLVTSNHDSAVVAERQKISEANFVRLARYLERLRDAGIATSSQQFSGYAIVALIAAAAREAAIDTAFSQAKCDGIISIVLKIAGFDAG
jgi:hypothetical protein